MPGRKKTYIFFWSKDRKPETPQKNNIFGHLVDFLFAKYFRIYQNASLKVS